MRVLAATPDEFGWLAGRSHCVLTSDFRAIKAVDGSGRTRGMVGYESWTPNAVQAHMAVDAPIVWRSLLRPAFEYPFRQCGKRLLIATVPAGNARSMAMVFSMGFREAHRFADGWADGEDLVVLEMTRDECRWLGAEGKA